MRWVSCVVVFSLTTSIIALLAAGQPVDMDTTTINNFDARPVPPFAPLPLSIYDALARVPTLQTAAQFLQAWHDLGHRANAAARDVVHVIDAVRRMFALLARRRTDIYDAAPWFLRSIVEVVMG